jgi:hypothetical protein
MAPESNFHSPGTLEFMHTHMRSFQLHSAPETGMGKEQVVQERERNTRDNLSLLVRIMVLISARPQEAALLRGLQITKMSLEEIQCVNPILH